MSTNCDVITFFAIYGQFAAIRKPDSGRMICKTYNSYQNCYQKISNTALILLLWVKVLLLLKNVDLLQKTVDIMKIKGVLLQKGIFSETTYLFVLLHQISSFQHTPPTPKKCTLIRVKYWSNITYNQMYCLFQFECFVATLVEYLVIQCLAAVTSEG